MKMLSESVLIRHLGVEEETEGSQKGYNTGTLLTLSESLGPSIAGHLISTQTAGVGISYSTLDADESTIYLPGS